ncbi:hypothetical protein F5146DRAFT_1012804 [Armillaria mellea]|nr:hypothetical protein F5146DRAFT_1012804 [Armillaria mellea]
MGDRSGMLRNSKEIVLRNTVFLVYNIALISLGDFSLPIQQPQVPRHTWLAATTVLSIDCIIFRCLVTVSFGVVYSTF